MKRKNRKVIIYIIVPFLVIGFAQELFNAALNWMLEAERKEAEATALTWSDSSTTRQAAKAWLEDQGYQSLILEAVNSDNSSRNTEGRADKVSHVVHGWKQLRAGNWFEDPSSLVIEFKFAEEDRLHDIRTYLWPFESHPFHDQTINPED